MAIVSVNRVGLSACDERYWVYDDDLTHTFDLESIDGRKIGAPLLLSFELMYTIGIYKEYNLDLMLGCDVTHCIKNCFRNSPITLTSNEWKNLRNTMALQVSIFLMIPMSDKK